MSGLKLLAFDADDLAVLSAHLQDATLLARDLAYLKAERRFVLVARRRGESEGTPGPVTGLNLGHVERVERLNLPTDQPDLVLTVVGALFQPGEAPAGQVLLLFEGGRSLRFTVECIEAVMADLDAPPSPET